MRFSMGPPRFQALGKSLTEYRPGYGQRLHEFKPGMIGWPWVNGRNTTPSEQKLSYEFWYADNLYLDFDVIIILKITREGFKIEGETP